MTDRIKLFLRAMNRQGKSQASLGYLEELHSGSKSGKSFQWWIHDLARENKFKYETSTVRGFQNNPVYKFKKIEG